MKTQRTLHLRWGLVLAAMGLLLAWAPTTWVGSSFAATPNHAGTAASSPTYGGSYTYGLAAAPDCLDPQKTALGPSNRVDGYILDPLLDIDTKGHYVGDLATGYTISNGGLRITFHLRQGVRFSNGDPFTAAAVKYTLDRAVSPATKSPLTAGQLAQLAGTTVINKYEVRLDLKTTFRPILTNLANASTGILDPKAPPACDQVVGTGPYKLESVGAGFSTITVVANKHHTWATSWVRNKAGVPWVTTVTFQAIQSDTTAISDLLTGGLDVAVVPGTQLDRVQGNAKITVHKTPSVGLTFMEFNTAHAPFDTAQARKAVTELIDRSAIIEAALGGQGKPVYVALPPANADYDKNAGKYLPHLNTADAARIIAANHLSGPYTLLTLNTPQFTTTAEILQAAAAQAGMKLSIVAQSLGDFITSAGKGEFDALVIAAGSADPDILYSLLDSSQGGGKGLNWTNYTDPQLDSLLVRGRETLNAKKAQQDYDQAQVRINKLGIFVGIDVATTLSGWRSNIKGYHLNRLYNFGIQDLYIKSK